MRGAEASRVDSRGGAFGVFRSVGLPQRTLGRIEGISGARAAAGEVSAVRDADGGAQSPFREASEDEFHRSASGLSRKRPGAAGENSRFAAEHVRGYRRGAGGTGTATLFGARFSGEVSGPRADGKRHLRRERIQMVFPGARNAGRIF